MTILDKPRAQAAATLAVHLRKLAGFTEWHMAGTLTALEAAAGTASAFEVSQAIVRLAAMPEMKTPALLAQPGPWWPTAHDGSTIRRRGDHTMTCPDPKHGGERMPCGQCASNTGAPPAEVQAEIRAALEAAKTTHHQRDAEKAAREEKKRCAT